MRALSLLVACAACGSSAAEPVQPARVARTEVSPRACPDAQAMTFVCGRPLQGEACAPSRGALTDVTQLPGAPAVSVGTPRDETWSATYAARGRSACCYVACIPLDVREAPVSTHDYRDLRCVVAPTTGCPEAVRFEDDWPGHVAARQEHAVDVPLPAGAQPCCYGTAPLAAIGPL